MRLCRYRLKSGSKAPAAGFFFDERIVPVLDAAAQHGQNALADWTGADLLPLLSNGAQHAAARNLHEWVASQGLDRDGQRSLAVAAVELLTPIPQPPKLFLLAGNYSDHIAEGGGKAEERQNTFPYVFMKPPSTTLVDPNQPVVIPRVSPNTIDWELELGVVIGKRCKHVKEADALGVVAGYVVVNDISNRKFRPNPNRKQRDKDSFFDWQHGKWADSFCPVGPCVTAASAIPNPQALRMQLLLNGQIRQDASTQQQIFPVAAVIEFLTSFVTLEPGDIISTGTPAGVGNTTGTYLKPGDRLEAKIEGIGNLVSPVVMET